MSEMNQPQDAVREMDEPDAIDLTEYVGLLVENRYLIGGITLILFVGSLLYASLATPIYRADATVQIETAGMTMRGDLAAVMGAGEEASSSTEMEIIRSRRVIGDVVSRLNLDVIAEPVRFPLVGDYIARRRSSPPGEAAPPLFGMESYAWGGEVIEVARFDLPSALFGTTFELVAGEAGAYQLFALDGGLLLEGAVGQAGTNEGFGISLFVRHLVARPGTRFTLAHLSPQSLTLWLQGQLKVAEQGRGTGILSISMEGTDREHIRNIVQAVTQSYLRQNVERRSEESEKMLSFINEQMPKLRGELAAAEQAMNLHREKVGSIDLNYESQNLLQRITEIEAAISTLKLERTELAQKLTDAHPTLRALDEKMGNLRAQHAELDKQVRRLPEAEFEQLQLNRDVTVTSELYTLLLNKSQELKVSKAGTIGAVRVIDDAIVGLHPIKPRKGVIVSVSLLLGLILGVIVAILRRALNRTVDDPAQIERQLGCPVYAEIPYSEYQEAIDRKGRGGGQANFLLAQAKPDDLVVESLRSLRTSMQFALLESENNVVCISGPAPAIGKSFVSANFAYLLADSGRRVLLIDADLRKGHMERYFGLGRSPGLSEYLIGACDLTAALRKGVLHENLHLLPAGVYPPNPSELLLSDAFRGLLEKVRKEYDLVIIDTPPILAVTDAAIVAQYAGASFMVVRSGRHPMRELHTTMRRFQQNGVQVKGVIFNGIPLMKKGAGYRYGYGYKYYGYQYEYK